MKVDAIGLEVLAKISVDELLTLGSEGLEGVMRFRDNFENKRDIRVSIKYNGKQKEFVEVRQEPKGYFGFADNIQFTINSYFLNRLQEFGDFGSRFPYNSAGKLEIRIIR